MATFNANPDSENEPWIERAALEGFAFRNWHLMFFCFATVTTFLILICCCVRIRIPRTKQQIEGDYRRRKLAEKFQERLRMIQCRTDMEVTDLRQALKLIQQDFDEEEQKIKTEMEDEKKHDFWPGKVFNSILKAASKGKHKRRI